MEICFSIPKYFEDKTYKEIWIKSVKKLNKKYNITTFRLQTDEECYIRILPDNSNISLNEVKKIINGLTKELDSQ